MANIKRYRSDADLVDQLRDEFNSWLTPFSDQFSRKFLHNIADWLPAADIQDEGNQFVVHADLPGVQTKDIHIHLEDNVLVLEGVREAEKKQERNNYLRVERSSGSFSRRFSLPEAVNIDKISATNKNGVLEIILPKAKPHISHKISVKDSLSEE